MPAALAEVAGEFATALLSGADLGWRGFRLPGTFAGQPEIQAAVETALSGVAGGLLNDAETVQYLTGAVSGLFNGLLGDAAVSASGRSACPADGFGHSRRSGRGG